MQRNFYPSQKIFKSLCTAWEKFWSFLIKFLNSYQKTKDNFEPVILSLYYIQGIFDFLNIYMYINLT